MVPAERIELPTFGLQNRCTTAVLRRRCWLVGQKAADEIFSTGNISKVVPVIGFDDKALTFGPKGRKARELYWAWAHR